MSELLRRLRSSKSQNTSAAETIGSIVETKSGTIVFVFKSRHEDLVWCIKEVLMLLKQSGKSKATTAQITFGPVLNSIEYDPNR